MAVTIREIAKQLNISHSTVSRVLNNRGEAFISEVTRQRVLEASKQLGYQPNLSARALATGRTGTVAVWSSSVGEPYYWQMLNALEAAVTSRNLRMLVRRSRDAQHDLKAVLEMSDVDGVIAVDAFPEIRGPLAVSPGLGVPCVFVGVYSPDYSDRVIVDLSPALRDALAIMLQAGRKRIAYLVNDAYSRMVTNDEVRYRVYVETMHQAGREPELIVFQSTFGEKAGPALSEHIALHGAPDAILCQNDVVAMVAYRALRDHGLAIPEDVLLVGCDGIRETKFFDPPLSTIVQPIEEMCKLAVEFLENRIENPDCKIQTTTLKGMLAARRSLGEQYRNQSE